MVVGSFRLFDGVVEDVAVAVLGDRAVEHANDVLELFGDDGGVGVSAFATVFSCLAWAWQK